MPKQARPGMEFRATTTTRRAERQSPSRVPGAVHPRLMGAPSSNSGRGTAAVVAQKATLNLDNGRALWQSEAALVENAIKSTAPNDSQALIDMRRSGPALNTGEATEPQARIAAGQSDPGWQGSNPRAQQALSPIQMHQVQIPHNQSRPTTATRNKVVKQSVDGLRPVLNNWTKEPQAGKRQARDHAKFPTSSQHLSTSAAVPGGVTVRHGHRARHASLVVALPPQAGSVQRQQDTVRRPDAPSTAVPRRLSRGRWEKSPGGRGGGPAMGLARECGRGGLQNQGLCRTSPNSGQNPIHTYHTIPYHTRPDQNRPDQTRPDQTRPDQTIPYHTLPYHTIPYHTVLLKE